MAGRSNKPNVPTRKEATGKNLDHVLACLRDGLTYTETAKKTGYDRCYLYDLRGRHLEEFAVAEAVGARVDMDDANRARRCIMNNEAEDSFARLKAVELTNRLREKQVMEVRLTVGEATDWGSITPQAMQLAIEHKKPAGAG